ncbi:MAG: hypothetical protein IMF09_08535 [Proteobacteria bacterium]|nr:hypothetical protein [Pseudomonadota bacterium]
MQIVKLQLDHLNFYCPVTGRLIYSNEGWEDDSPALKGYWVNLSPEVPYYITPEMTEPWKTYLASIHEDDTPDAAEFLAAIEEPNWIAFECSFAGITGDTGWIVIDMNYDLNA